MSRIWNFIKMILAMGGILLDKFNLNRVLLLGTIVILYFYNRWINENTDLLMAVLHFYLFFINRYIFLFLSFIKNGIADKLKKKFGEEKGFEVYQFITALMFFQGAASFGIMVNKSVGAGLPPLAGYGYLIVAAGILLMIIGFIINVWSTYLVGIDVYYYKDLFLGRAVSNFEKSGPYLYLSNPMYGWGQANGYGTALIHASVLGIGGIFLNQLLMYIFYYTIEKPHIKRVFGVQEIQT
jgi:hypothetical protein